MALGLGLFLLGAISARTVVGMGAALLAGLALAVAAYVALSCLAGRAAAGLRNACALHAAHSDLGNFMRTNGAFRAARRGISRPAH